MSTLPGDLELRAVPGPSALGGGLRRALELLYIIASSEFKRTYFNTVLGYIWSICRPLALFGVLLTVFTQVFRLGSDVPNYPVLLLFNLVLFTFFQEATMGAVGCLVGQESVIRKTQFPRVVVPLATVLTAVFNLGPNLVVVFVFMLAYGVDPTWTWLLVPVIVLLTLAFTVGVSLLLAALYPRFRDVGIIWSVGITALLYATPVLYPLDAVSPTLRAIVSLNPLSPVFGLARDWIIDPRAPGPAELAGSPWRFAASCLLYLAVIALGVLVFRREAPLVAEQL